ncbi:protein LAZY 1 [Brachypodium distachyon]|uniref:Protein LAZY 1 n=1 Tax=Brachypodium distachyon TaxID=15368 RepID=A0A0Q3ELS4_BRADI|nr:protein LAZY 1 [Brachypodium distachyon]KQJ88511.1 hypothetical protein BRADI_4g19040v3 [Brachypodium distachyon]|eukprot:XP_010237715.1 protein LAZY 1 [Brachypodium distachyon]
MTLLGWMHRKLRSNNDVFKEFNTGGGGSCNCITGLASPDGEYFVDGTFAAANHHSQPMDADVDDLFAFGGSGLLTIGTLGFAAAVTTIPGDDGEHDAEDEADHDDADVDVQSNDADDDGTDNDADDGAVTPTFTFPAPAEMGVEAIAEKDDGATTEDDLMLVSAELEKVLGATANGDVPSARVSFAATDCPLQGFLFGSPVCSDAESKRDSAGGGGRRASLGELFLRTRFAEENKVALVTVAEGEDGGEGDKAEGKGGGGGGGRKRMKKWKVKDEKGAGADGSRVDPKVTKSKFQKILQIFHRKVYPEGTAILARNLTKKNRKRGAPDNGDGGPGTDEPVVPPKRTGPRMPSLGCCANRASFSASPDHRGELLNGSKSGHWIKTDADYLVLEL